MPVASDPSLRPWPRPWRALAPLAACLALCLAPGLGLAKQTPLLRTVEIVTGGAAPDARLPMIIAVHGLGDRPEAFVRLFEGLPLQARVIAPAGKRAYGRGYTWFALSTDAGVDRVADMRDSAQRLAHLATTLTQTRPTVGKPVITGFSQGGMLSFLACADTPALYAACLPVGGLLPSPLRPDAKPRGTAPPVYALHGGADTRVPLAGARQTVAAFVASGRPAELQVFPGVGHRLPAPVRRALFDQLARLLPSP